MAGACMAIYWATPGIKGRTFVSSGFSTEGLQLLHPQYQTAGCSKERVVLETNCYNIQYSFSCVFQRLQHGRSGQRGQLRRERELVMFTATELKFLGQTLISHVKSEEKIATGLELSTEAAGSSHDPKGWQIWLLYDKVPESSNDKTSYPLFQQ